jgi:Fe-S-cluster-containing dehydrogenase component
MKSWRMIIDVEKCEDCNNCTLACKDEFMDNDWPGYSVAQPRHGQRWIDVARKERGEFPLIDIAYRPITCMHCADAPCVAAAEGAIYRRKDGIVLIDPEKAKGRNELVGTCPYGVIWWNEEREVAQKCTFCAHLIDKGWKQPRCVQACPTGALRVEFIEDAEMERIAAKEKLQPLHPEHETRPAVYYANLYRFDSCFIAGSVAVEKNQLVDCAAGASVILYQDGRKLAETATDAFGDFKFDGLQENSTGYRVEIVMKGYGRCTLPLARLEKSVNLGVIRLG